MFKMLKLSVDHINCLLPLLWFTFVWAISECTQKCNPYMCMHVCVQMLFEIWLYERGCCDSCHFQFGFSTCASNTSGMAHRLCLRLTTDDASTVRLMRWGCIEWKRYVASICVSGELCYAMHVLVHRYRCKCNVILQAKTIFIRCRLFCVQV